MNGDEEERTEVDRRAASRMSAGDGESATAAQPDRAGAGSAADELAQEREKAEAYHRNWQRAAADLINYKRRVEQERQEQARLANAALVINLLPVFDDLDRAVATVDSTLAGLNWVQGVVAIQRKFANLMEAMGVSEVPAEGQAFDPNLHEAVGRQPGPENTCIHVVQKGYALGDKVIRPAMVVVGDGEAPEGAS